MTWIIELIFLLHYEANSHKNSWSVSTVDVSQKKFWILTASWKSQEKKWLSFSLFPTFFFTSYLLIFDLWPPAWWQHRTLQKYDDTLVPWIFFSEFHHIFSFGLVCKFGQIIDEFSAIRAEYFTESGQIYILNQNWKNNEIQEKSFA